jgi:hypothetical protein
MLDLIQIFADTLSGILINLPYFILIIWGIRIIAREMPKWLKIYHDNNIKEIAMQRAINMKQ